MKKRIAYSAVVLDETSKQKLLDTLEIKSLIKDEMTIYAHHMTIRLGSLVGTVHESRLGQRESLMATKIGRSKEGSVVAVAVAGAESDNLTPHVTIAVDLLAGSRPKDSNYITEWENLKEPILLNGIVQEL